MNARNLIAALVVSPLLAGAALAQEAAVPQMSMEDAYAAAQNQLGVLEYCQTKADVGNEVIATQNRLMGMIPPPSDTTEAIDAYQKGKTGTVSSMGQEVALADVAQQRSTSEESLCQQMAQLVTQAGDQIPPG